MGLLQFDFSGDMLAKLEAYERDLAVRTSLGREDLRWLTCGDCSEPSDGHRACDASVVEFREIPDVGRELVDVSRARAAASGVDQMRRGANDSNTAPMEIDALQQHGDKKCHTCGRFGHLAKDCWQNKSKSKGKDARRVTAKARGRPTRTSA